MSEMNNSPESTVFRDPIGDVRWALGRGIGVVAVAAVGVIALAIVDPTALGELGLTLPRALLASGSVWVACGVIMGLGRRYLSSLLGSSLAGCIGGAMMAIALSVADFRGIAANFDALRVFVFAVIGTGAGINLHFQPEKKV